MNECNASNQIKPCQIDLESEVYLSPLYLTFFCFLRGDNKNSSLYWRIAFMLWNLSFLELIAFHKIEHCLLCCFPKILCWLGPWKSHCLMSFFSVTTNLFDYFLLVFIYSISWTNQILPKISPIVLITKTQIGYSNWTCFFLLSNLNCLVWDFVFLSKKLCLLACVSQCCLKNSAYFQIFQLFQLILQIFLLKNEPMLASTNP